MVNVGLGGGRVRGGGGATPVVKYGRGKLVAIIILMWTGR